MGKLTPEGRKRLAREHPEDFVYPPTPQHPLGRFPIENRSHAIAAESRVSQFGSPAEKARVRAAVHARYPNLPCASCQRIGSSHRHGSHGCCGDSKCHYELQIKHAVAGEAGVGMLG